jgi:hypothetical protein
MKNKHRKALRRWAPALVNAITTLIRWLMDA